MNTRLALVLAGLSLVAFPFRPVHAQEPGSQAQGTGSPSQEPAAPAPGEGYTTLSAGWSSLAGGPIKDSYESGIVIAASFRTPVSPFLMQGLEVGYSWFAVDTGALESENPGSTFSGDDLGLLSITTENDFLLGNPSSATRPFVNTGMGYYRSFSDDPTETTGSGSATYPTGVYRGSFFGFHAGIGVLITKERFGLRIDANYQLLFQSGDNLEFFPIRAGIVFLP